MIQLIRHQFSRKRGALSGFLDDEQIRDHVEERELLEIVREDQLDILSMPKKKNAMDLHVDELIAQYRNLTTGVNPASVHHALPRKVEMSADNAHALLSKIKGEAKEDSENDEAFSDINSRGDASKPECFVDRERFFEGMTKDQKVAGEFMLNKLDKSEHNDQLLMLLHGPPGTGKTFLIERLRKMTNVKMRITATSGVAAMSLHGTTIDHFLGKGRGKRKKKMSKLETVRRNLGTDTTLLVLDEVSMLGCAKLLELDTTLQKLKKSSAPFGGLDVVIIGDFAQLPPVKQTSLIEAMVSSLLLHTPATEITLKTTALFSRFRKFELQEFTRCKSRSPLSSLLRQFRNCLSRIGSLTAEDIKRIGILDGQTLTKDSKFGDATFLVSTRKEKDAIISFAGKMWAEENNRPLYWWFKRPVSFSGCSEDADDIAQSMHRRCSGAKEYYIQGCGATLKHNIAPSWLC